MKLLINQGEYERLLELKFKLKRKAHMAPLTPLEIVLLQNCEEKLQIDSQSIHQLLKLSQNPDLMVG